VIDEVVLTIPRDRRFHDIAHLVVGGLAIRLSLTVDNLADLQLAVAGLLPRADADGDVTVALHVSDGVLDGRIGPFRPESLRRELEQVGEDGYGTRHVLESVFDSYRVDQAGGSGWVAFAMAIAPAVEGAR
jgi:hypothetical protein